jgi:hypothetical protein
MYFSKSQRGFYSEDIHGQHRITVPDPAWTPPQAVIFRTPETLLLFAGTDADQLTMPDPAAVHPLIEMDNPDCKIPADAVEISDAEHAALLAGQSAGKCITADADGRPVLTDPPATPFAQQKAAELALYRADREKMLNRLAGIGMAAQATGDSTLASAIVAFRKGLLDLPGHPSITGAANLADLRLAMKTRYAALLKDTPAAAKLAFAGVDA